MKLAAGDASKSACGPGWKPKMRLNDPGKLMPDADLLAAGFQVPGKGSAIRKKGITKWLRSD